MCGKWLEQSWTKEAFVPMGGQHEPRGSRLPEGEQRLRERQDGVRAALEMRKVRIPLDPLCQRGLVCEVEPYCSLFRLKNNESSPILHP